MKVANSFLNSKNRRKLDRFMISLIKDKTEGNPGFRENLATAAANGDCIIKNFIVENFGDIWDRIITDYPSLGVELSPFFKIGLSTVRTCLTSDSLGH